MPRRWSSPAWAGPRARRQHRDERTMLPAPRSLSTPPFTLSRNNDRSDRARSTFSPFSRPKPTYSTCTTGSDFWLFLFCLSLSLSLSLPTILPSLSLLLSLISVIIDGTFQHPKLSRTGRVHFLPALFTPFSPPTTRHITQVLYKDTSESRAFIETKRVCASVRAIDVK